MISRKLLLSLATISILYSGCNDEEKTKTEEKVQVKQVQSKEVVVKKPKIEEIETVKTETPIIEKVVIAPNATTLFQKCISCHGKNAEKKALNKSEIIKDWEASKIVTALKGYKDETYGGAMKALMKSQVANLSDEDIELLANHIADFK